MADNGEIDIGAMRALLVKERNALVRAATAEDRASVELDQPAIGRLSRMDAMRAQGMAEASEAPRAPVARRRRRRADRGRELWRVPRMRHDGSFHFLLGGVPSFHLLGDSASAAYV